MSELFLCSICNISSGSCEEDCAFCAQSVHNEKRDIKIYKEKSLDDILDELEVAKKFGSLGFCLVTSGASLDDKKLEYVSKCAREIKKRGEIFLIACCGIASKEALRELVKSGVDSYNHNIESSKEFYKNICQTHSWDDRYNTALRVKESGLKLCSGGIFGLGESEDDREEYLKALKSLNPHSSPINFFQSDSALELGENRMSRDEAIFWIKRSRAVLEESMLMVAGGREAMFGENQKEIFQSGVNAIVIGDYLTKSGAPRERDIEMIKRYGLKIATSCH